MKKIIAAAALTLAVSGPALGADFEVRITNLTLGSNFTPLLVAAHTPSIALYELGTPPSAEIANMAEGGDTSGLEAILAAAPDQVSDFGSSGDLLGPGLSVSVIVEGTAAASLISVVGMMLPTNDSFVGADGLRAPRAIGATRDYFAVGYDAGSEPNDEDCANIPGPTCGGAGPSPDEGGEGYIHVSRGIAGSDSLTAAGYDWRNPVARISITRLN